MATAMFCSGNVPNASARRPSNGIERKITSSSSSRLRVFSVTAKANRQGGQGQTARNRTAVRPSAISVPLPGTAGGGVIVTTEHNSGNGPIPSLRELRNAIPKECFVPDVQESLKYFAVDFSALLFCFGVLSPLVVDNPLLLPIYAPITGTVMWMNFVIGHDCGHGSFSGNKLLNAVIGHVTHAPLLVPFWPWAYSHKQHHRFHQHETKDMSHPWMTAETYQGTNPVVRWLALDHWWGAFLGFPGYLLLEQKWASTDGSHFWPASRLFDKAPKDERLKCAVSTLACAGFLGLTFAVTDGVGAWSMQYLAPYLCFSWWLFAVTYLQHHDEDTETYSETEWEYVLGGLQTIDRTFGFGVDRITHHITDCHVAHHMFTDMPHYNLEKATEGVVGVLEPRGLYKKRDTKDFVAKTFQLQRDVGHCIERDRPRATVEEIKKSLGLTGFLEEK